LVKILTFSSRWVKDRPVSGLAPNRVLRSGNVLVLIDDRGRVESVSRLRRFSADARL
jgi:hypothetical protein